MEQGYREAKGQSSYTTNKGERMKINNKKGHWCCLPAVVSHAWPLTQSIAVGIGGVLIAACAWHAPAWTAAKANHTEVAYQSQEMFPQQLFDKLPGGTPGRTIGAVATGNGGNLAGGVQTGG